MEAILNFFKGIADTIVTLVDFAISLLGDFFSFLQLFGRIPEVFTSLISWMPLEFISTFFACLSLVILYKILGRD